MKEIDISRHIKEFNDHLKIEENLRIVFLGTFGSGKTYFLNRFFERNSEYQVIKIFPVNYAVLKH